MKACAAPVAGELRGTIVLEGEPHVYPDTWAQGLSTNVAERGGTS
jgi:hypothetical protein